MAKILIGVSGSIAAYKIADVVSQLTKLGHQVQCILTDSAQQFVSPLVLETLSGNPVRTALFGPDVSGTEHIDLARWADLYLVAPATANVLARLALGMADDLLTTVALASEAPMLIAPAMNTVMWNQPITRQHVEALTERGVAWVDPAAGTLACGEVGIGKLANPEAIVASVVAHIQSTPQSLAGQHILVTAGPTTTPIDAVRYITNHSTGRMGAAMVEAALRRGARVTLVLGIDKGVVRPLAPRGAADKLTLIEVRTAEDMAAAALAALPAANGVVASAAVMDYRVAEPAENKTKRSTEAVNLALVPSVDVLGRLRDAARPGQWFMGFAAETDDLAANGRRKLVAKRLDFVFANQVARSGEASTTGFGVTTNGGLLLSADGAERSVQVQDKTRLADSIWDSVLAALA